MSLLITVDPRHPCDRCGHESRMHLPPERGSRCAIVDGRFFRGERIPKGLRAKQCLCDGYFPRP